VSLDEYESVRSRSTWFLLAPGHVPNNGIWAVPLWRSDRYLIVLTLGPAAAIAEELDPRA
jgi:hypothetical protein